MSDAPRFLYIRGLRRVDHTVFALGENGMKTYWDPQFRRTLAFSSGQQVKRSLLDHACALLDEERSPVVFNRELKNDKMSEKEPWSACDPRFADQLLGGWMRAPKNAKTIKRRSPLSISAMRPLHPLLASTSEESVTFDRSDDPEHHPVRVVDGKGEEVPDEAIEEFLASNNRNLPRKNWVNPQERTTGLYIYDIAIDLEHLFEVSTHPHEPQITPEVAEALEEDGWVRISEHRLAAPSDRRPAIIGALARAIVRWRITSNQSRTFNPQSTLALAIAPEADRVTGAIRATLGEAPEPGQFTATPVLDRTTGAEIFATPEASAVIVGPETSPEALDEAVNRLEEEMLAHTGLG